MKLSAKAEYGCMAIIALAMPRSGAGPVRVREIAETYGIPERYLVQILLQLKAAGLVHSARGSSGGYRLARDPRQISLGEVLGVIDGPGDPPREITGPAAHALSTIWERLQSLPRDFLNQITIAQLANQTSPQDWVI
jgi:Rrf2 family transcriptional regulator, cysteine metabolism repressor